MDVDHWLAQHATWASEDDPPAEDRSLVRELVRQSLEDLSTEFQEEGGLGLLSDLRLEIVVHGKPAEVVIQGKTQRVCEGQSPTYAEGRNGRTFATTRILAPSRHSPAARTIIGEPMDRDYVHKTLVHEMSMLFLWQLTRRKSAGWGLWDPSTPQWFYDGYEEYLSLIRSTPHARQVTRPKYRARAQANLATGVPIDVYVQGALTLEYLHERFGRARLIALLRSEQPTFQDALRTALGCDETAILDGWRAWMRD
jgi:hypothetical protein